MASLPSPSPKGRKEESPDPPSGLLFHIGALEFSENKRPDRLRDRCDEVHDHASRILVVSWHVHDVVRGSPRVSQVVGGKGC